MPNQKSFPYLPFCLQRDYVAPYGLVDDLIPLQQERNYLKTKLLHLIGAKLIIKERDLSNSNDFFKEKERIVNELIKLERPRFMISMGR